MYEVTVVIIIWILVICTLALSLGIVATVKIN